MRAICSATATFRVGLEQYRPSQCLLYLLRKMLSSHGHQGRRQGLPRKIFTARRASRCPFPGRLGSSPPKWSRNFPGNAAWSGQQLTSSIGLCKTVAKEGGKHRIRANVICPGYVRTPLVDKQIPEQARELGISEEEVVKNVMLRETVDGEFTTESDVAEVALLFAAFESNALTGQSLVVSHGWFMQ